MLIDTKLIEDKIAELQAQVKNHSAYINEIVAAIEKLNTDKATASNNINIINGAIQAYTDVMNVMKSAEGTTINGSGNVETGSN